MSDVTKAIERLKNCAEADHDGVVVFASRPAIDKVCNEIERLQALLKKREATIKELSKEVYDLETRVAEIELTPYQEDKIIRQELEWLVNYEPTEDIEEWRKMADAARILLECYGYLPKQPSEARQGAENALQETD